MEDNNAMTQNDFQQFYLEIEAAKNEIRKVVVGQDQVVDLLLIGLFANGHCLLEGVPGIAKTLLAKTLAKTLQCDFSRIQFTPDLMPADILGTSIFNVKEQNFEFKKGPIFSNIVLIDEINRAPAKTQSALFEVMAERQITIDDHHFDMNLPFIVFATQNPIEQEGTYRLPEAQLDRFIFKINMDYPSKEEEIKMLNAFDKNTLENMEREVNAKFDSQSIIRYQKAIQKIEVEEKIIQYIASIVISTRNNPFLYLGASPRASLALLKSSKVNAAMNGRHFIIPDDVKKVAYAVLEHRIILSPEKEIEGITPHQIVSDILNQNEIPR